MVMGWFARSSGLRFVITDAVEVAGVVEETGSPAVPCVEVFVQHGDARVVEYEAPLVADVEVQEVGEDAL